MKFRILLFLAVAALLVTSACIPPTTSYRAARPTPPAPCTVPVNPITYNNLVASISVNYTYNAKDPTQARPWHQEDVLEYLNSLGKADGNTFAFQNGNPVNFYFAYTINNDGQDHFTGNLQFSGWGQGFIHNFGTQYSYTDTGMMTRDLTAQAYSFIHTGWHDSRPGCENGPVASASTSKKHK